MASPKLTILLGFTLLAFQQETFCDERADQGTEAYSRFSEFVKYENHLLDVQRLSITRVNLPIECALGCVRLPGCLSFNIEIDKPLEIASSLLCELLSAGKLGNSRRFRRSKKFDHYETSTPCKNSPCGSGGICIPDYHNGLYTCSCPALGNFTNPGRSCKDINDKNGHSLGDGEYWIDPLNTGIPFTVYCDMTTDGGGWTMLKQLLIPNNISELTESIIFNDYRILSKYSQNSQFVSINALKKLRQAMDFQQLRWYCFKKSRGRVFHVMTTHDAAGLRVLDYFIESPDSPVKSCGSFTRLPDDNSTLAQNCRQWGGGNQWGSQSNRSWRFYSKVVTCRIENEIMFSFRPNPWCDDNKTKGVKQSLSAGDLWQVYVR